MGGLFSKSQPQRSKDPRWQGIGPNTPLPNSPTSSSSNNFQNQPGYGRNGAGAGGPGNTLTTIDTTTTTTTTKQTKTKHKSSKFNLLLKLDPKGGGQRRVITKNLISLPSDFRHTGHIGAGEVRSGQIDPEKIKNQMMEVAACLKLDLNSPMPVLKTMPVIPDSRENVYNGPEQVDRYSTRPREEAAF